VFGPQAAMQAAAMPTAPSTEPSATGGTDTNFLLDARQDDRTRRTA
jgi:hypothetical protein